MPLWIKSFQTAFVVILIPIYTRLLGVKNFLWFSDIALFLTVPALWLESCLLGSLVAVSVGILECLWVFDCMVQLLIGHKFLGLAQYMFDPTQSPVMKTLSAIFHVMLPTLSLWMLRRFGYDRRALKLQTLVSWIVLPVCYLITDPLENVNWVFGLGATPQHIIDPRLYLVIAMIGFPIVVYLPSDLIAKKIARRVR